MTSGYGVVRVRWVFRQGLPALKRPLLAHRFAYLLVHGELAWDDCVLHRCDERRCVRESHLFLGDRGDNNRDTVAKGRHSHGVTHCWARIDDAIAREMRCRYAAGERIVDLARAYGVTPGLVWCVITGRTWKHVE